MLQTNDPFNSGKRVKNDQTGVRCWEKKKTDQGLIIFHTVVGNQIIVLDMKGKVLRKFSKPPNDYSIYRPGKKGNNRNIICILVRNDNRKKRCIACIDEYGKIIWKTSHHWLTHDFNVKGNGHIWSVIREDRILPNSDLKISNNVIIEMNMRGKILWKWSLYDNLKKFKNGKKVLDLIKKHRNDNPFHINSIDFADYQCSYDFFNEPVVVVSARNMNTVFLIGRSTGKVVFELNNLTIGQHHARLLPETFPVGGSNIIIFDNGYNFMPESKSRKFSRLIEVDVKTKKIVWEYRSKNKHNQPNFFSPIVGGQQRFANGNTLITEGYYGRIFEIDYKGNIVWDYVYPEANTIDNITSPLHKIGLRQIYRAYKVGYDWIE